MVVFRLLAQEEKSAALRDAIQAERAGLDGQPLAFRLRPESFRLLPSSPFAYWVSEALRRRVVEFPQLEGRDRTVRQGLATADDFRFIRAWWEVSPGKILDAELGPRRDIEAFRSWCHLRTRNGKKWVFMARGGDYSPFYADIQMVVNWEDNGREIKERINPTSGKPYSNVWQLKGTEQGYFFRRGLSFPRRVRRFAMSVVPDGCIFSDNACTVFFSRQSELESTIGLYSTQCIRFLLSLLTVTRKFEVGLIRMLPFVERTAVRTASLELVEWAQRSRTRREEQILFGARTTTIVDSERLRRTLESEAISIFGLTPTDQLAMNESISSFERLSNETAIEDGDAEAEEDTESDDRGSAELPSSDSLLSIAIGCVVGRWDVRLLIDRSLAPTIGSPFEPLPVSPAGTLVGTNGLPGTPGGIVSEEWMRARCDNNGSAPENVFHPTIRNDEYPLEIVWDGILVDDTGHPRDVVARVRAVLDLLWHEKADIIEREACERLGVDDLREYFRSPGEFWGDHVKRYSKSRRKAPIYWLLQSSKRSYGLWLYYHRLDGDLLFKALTNYVVPKIQLEEGHRRDLQAQKTQVGTSGRAARQVDREIERQEALLAELRDFRDKLHKAASIGLKPDLDDGVVLNAAPLWELMPWKVAKDYWEELLQGKYEWSSIGKQLHAKGLVG